MARIGVSKTSDRGSTPRGPAATYEKSYFVYSSFSTYRLLLA